MIASFLIMEDIDTISAGRCKSPIIVCIHVTKYILLFTEGFDDKDESRSLTRSREAWFALSDLKIYSKFTFGFKLLHISKLSVKQF